MVADRLPGDVDPRTAGAAPVPAVVLELVHALAKERVVLGVLLVGSREHRDANSDYDLRVLVHEALDASRVREIERSLSLTRDDAQSRHFPLCASGVLAEGDVCIEWDTWVRDDLVHDLADVAQGRAVDAGRHHELLYGALLKDEHGALRALQESIAAAAFPRAIVQALLRTKPWTALKLFRTAVARDDTPRAASWFARVFEDSMRLLFAHNGVYYPGPKRSLLYAIDDLAWVPTGFALWWGSVFDMRMKPWVELLPEAERFAHEVARGPTP